MRRKARKPMRAFLSGSCACNPGAARAPSKATSSRRRFMVSASDHAIGAQQYSVRHFDAQRLRDMQIDHELEPGRSLHGQIARLRASQDAVDIACRTPILVDVVDAVRDERTFVAVVP